MWKGKTLDRLEQMLEEAMDGTFSESDYNETRLSRLESKWKQFLSASMLSRDSLLKEKENVKSLVSDISHQTKTPMTNIKLYVSLLEENLQKETNMIHQEENRKLLYEIIRQTEKLEFLIQSLIKMSRLESNLVEVKPSVQKVEDLLLAASEEIALKAEQKQIEIQNTYRGDATAFYDMKWTKEALGNVLDNAVKYSEPGKKILLSVTEYEIYTSISVKDQGIGIKEEDLTKIFGRFYRSEEVQQQEGVGIGLYLTREILKRENGYMKVRSKPGKGSEFILFLLKEMS